LEISLQKIDCVPKPKSKKKKTKTKKPKPTPSKKSVKALSPLS
jgi:hypothetical protein